MGKNRNGEEKERDIFFISKYFRSVSRPQEGGSSIIEHENGRRAFGHRIVAERRNGNILKREMLHRGFEFIDDCG